MAANLSALICISYQTAPLFCSNRRSAPASSGVPPTSAAVELRPGEDWIGRLAILIQLDPRASTSIIRTVQSSTVANVKGAG